MTAQTFHLTITLGSEQMRSGDDVHRALSLVGAGLANRFDGLDLPDYLRGMIRAKGGEVVGAWGTDERETAEEIASAVLSDLSRPDDTFAQIVEAVKIARGEVEA